MSDNELITEFLGNKPFNSGAHFTLNEYLNKGLYQQSWDWLMPVVEKIEAIHDDFHGYFGVHISSNGCTIQGTNLRTDPENFHPAYVADHYAESKLQATYNAVVEFIKWYNQR